MINPSRLFALSLLGLSLAACGQNAATPSTSADATTRAQRLLPQPCATATLNRSSVPVDDCGDPGNPQPPTPDPGGSGVVLAPGARILSDEALSYDPASGTLRVQRTTSTSVFSPGDVVIGGRTGATPGGVPPRRIVGITTDGDTITFTTQEAGLTDVIEEGSLDFTRTLSASDIAQIDPDPNDPVESLNSQKLLRALTVDCSSGGHKVYGKSFSKPFDTGSSLSGCFQIDFDTTLKLKIKHFKLDTFEASAKISEQAKLQLLLNSSASLKHDWNLGTVWFNSIDIQLGPVPLLITPYIKFTAGVDGSVTGTMSYEATQEASYKAGLQYANGKLSGINERTSSINIPDPTLSPMQLQAAAKAYVEARPGISFFTTVIAAHADGGVYAGIRAYAKLNVDSQKHPLWQLTAGPQFCYGYQAHLEILLGLIDKTWQNDQCGSEIRMFEKHSNDVGPVQPSSGNAWSNVTLNFTLGQGEVELHKLPASGGDIVIAHLSASGPFDLTPYIDPFDDTEFVVVGISKRSGGIFGSYGHQLDLSVTADNASIWTAGHRGCTACHSQQEYHFTVNKDLALLQPIP